jgi:hypothetical protein
MRRDENRTSAHARHVHTARRAEALETLWDGYLSIPPETLGDTLLLADRLASVRSPFDDTFGFSTEAIGADLDVAFGNDTLKEILQDFAVKVEALARILRA